MTKCKCEVDPKAPMALQDAQRTMGLIRFHAAEYHIDPHKIGVLRTSAGRHLVVDLSTHFETRWPELVETWLRTIGLISRNCGNCRSLPTGTGRLTCPWHMLRSINGVFGNYIHQPGRGGFWTITL